MPVISTPIYLPNSNHGRQVWRPTGRLTRTDSDVLRLGNPGNWYRNMVSNPNYKTTIAKGGNATNPYTTWGINTSSFRMPSVYFNGIVHYTNPKGDYEVFHNSSGFPLRPSFDFNYEDPVLKDQALARLKRRISDAVGNAQVVAPVVELRELHGLIHAMIDLTAGALITLGDIKRTKGKSAFKYASDAWLTYGFGIAPMMGDIQKISAAITSFIERQDNTLRLSGSAKRDWVTVYNSGPGIGGGPPGFSFQVRTNIHHELSYRYISAFDLLVGAGNDYSVMDHFGLTIPSLVPGFWELTAFSWVADYFGTVGAFLDDTFTANPTVSKYVVCNKRYRVKVHYELDVADPPYSPSQQSVVVEKQVRPGGYEAYYFNRASLSALPGLLLRFKTLDEIGRNGLNRLANLSSILVGSKLNYHNRVFQR